MGVLATLEPQRQQNEDLSPPQGTTKIPPGPLPGPSAVASATETIPVAAPPSESPVSLKEGELRLYHGDRGGAYRTLFFDHLQGSKQIHVEDPYIRSHHQVVNFLRFCELCVELGTVEKITLVTSYESELEKQEVVGKLTTVENSISEHGIELKFEFRTTLHDRSIRSDNVWPTQRRRPCDRD